MGPLVITPFPYRRIIVVGTSSSGKSTVAKKLSGKLKINYIELDALNWGHNWEAMPRNVFRKRVKSAIQEEAWVIDGNYRSVRDLIWPKAEAVVWLDYPLWVIIWRLTRRTFSRYRRREVLWGNNHESLQSHLKIWSDESLFHWVLKTYWRNRREYSQLFEMPGYRHLKVYRFRKPVDAESLLKELK